MMRLLVKAEYRDKWPYQQNQDVSSSIFLTVVNTVSVPTIDCVQRLETQDLMVAMLRFTFKGSATHGYTQLLERCRSFL